MHASETYFGFGSGISYAPDQRLEGSDAVLDFDAGFLNGALTFGRVFDNDWVVELEGSYRRNELEIVRLDEGPGFIITDTENTIQALSLMVNVAYQFDFQWPVKPYLGAGLGISGVALEVSEQKSPVQLLSDDAAAFAYQVYAGLLIPLGDRWQIAADYRWWQTAEFDMETDAGPDVSLDYSSRYLALNFRRLLGGARNPVLAPLPGDRSRFYTDLRLGASLAADTDVTNRFDTNLDAFDAGVAAAIALGYSHIRPSGRRLRGELELQGWTNEADVLDRGIFEGEFPMTGDVQVRGAAFNVMYDFVPSWKLNPYAGIGIGYAEIDYDLQVQGPDGFEPWVEDSHKGLSAQVLLGFGIRLTERTELNFNYRYWLAPDISLEDPAGAAIETEHATHLLLFGVRYGL